jgi:hypothetical protein
VYETTNNQISGCALHNFRFFSSHNMAPTVLSQQAVAPPGPSHSTARRGDALPLLSRVLPTVYLVLFPACAIGRSDLAGSRDPQCCSRESSSRNPDGQSQPRVVSTRSASLDLSTSRVKKLRCHASVPPGLHYVSGVPLCHVTFGASRFSEPTTPSPLLLKSPNAESPILRIRATCPSRNRRSRSNRGIALHGFDVHAIIALVNPDSPMRDSEGSSVHLRLKSPRNSFYDQ